MREYVQIFSESLWLGPLFLMAAIPLLPTDTSTASQPATYNRKHLREMVQHAKTAQVDRQLDVYFRAQQFIHVIQHLLFGSGKQNNGN